MKIQTSSLTRSVRAPVRKSLKKKSLCGTAHLCIFSPYDILTYIDVFWSFAIFRKYTKQKINHTFGRRGFLTTQTKNTRGQQPVLSIDLNWFIIVGQSFQSHISVWTLSAKWLYRPTIEHNRDRTVLSSSNVDRRDKHINCVKWG